MTIGQIFRTKISLQKLIINNSTIYQTSCMWLRTNQTKTEFSTTVITADSIAPVAQTVWMNPFENQYHWSRAQLNNVLRIRQQLILSDIGKTVGLFCGEFPYRHNKGINFRHSASMIIQRQDITPLCGQPPDGADYYIYSLDNGL